MNSQFLHFVYTLATWNGFTGVLWGAGLACLYKAARAEVILIWRAFCRFAARMHIKQSTLDTAAVSLLDKAQPAINQAFDDARAGLVAERATAIAVEGDQTPQAGSLMPKPVEAAPLPAVVAAVAVSQ